MLCCSEDAAFFIDRYCLIYDTEARDWIPFKLWRAQLNSLDTISANKRIVILKARQLGFTWLVLCYAIWLMIFRPIATVLLFSKRDNEAVEMVDFRLAGVIERLPAWLRPRSVETSKHSVEFSNGSRCMAFPTTAGQSYTATLAIIDEADKIPGVKALEKVLNAVKPTVDAGGQLILLSTAEKATPESLFKKIFTSAVAGENGYAPIFHGWDARPGRTREWYEAEKRAELAQTGSLDHLHQEYPETVTEALAPKVLDKRLAPQWLQQCWEESPRLALASRIGPAIPQLEVYAVPDKRHKYVIGADPAEGNPTSDDSAMVVLDYETGEEVASLAGKFEPSVFAEYIDQVGRWYNGAAVLVERNNHGHAVILGLRGIPTSLAILPGADGRDGWLSSARGKVLLYNACADALRNSETRLHSLATFNQLASIDGSTLRAPEGMRDDRADAFALGCQARIQHATTLNRKKPRVGIVY